MELNFKNDDDFNMNNLKHMPITDNEIYQRMQDLHQLPDFSQYDFLSDEFKDNYKSLVEDMKKYKDKLTDITSDYRVDKMNIEFEINEGLKSTNKYDENKIKYYELKFEEGRNFDTVTMSYEERSKFIKENLPELKHDEAYFDHLNNVDRIAEKFNIPKTGLQEEIKEVEHLNDIGKSLNSINFSTVNMTKENNEKEDENEVRGVYDQLLKENASVDELLEEHQRQLKMIDGNYDEEREKVLKELKEKYPFFDPNYEQALEQFKTQYSVNNVVETNYYEDDGDDLYYEDGSSWNEGGTTEADSDMVKPYKESLADDISNYNMSEMGCGTDDINLDQFKN